MVNTKLIVFDLASGTNLICSNIHVDQLRSIARTFGFKNQSVEKLLCGPDRFSFIRGGGYNLTKRFVTRAQYDSMKFNDYSPQDERVSKLLGDEPKQTSTTYVGCGPIPTVHVYEGKEASNG